MGLGQRFTQATASSISLTSHSQKPATNSRVWAKGVLARSFRRADIFASVPRPETGQNVIADRPRPRAKFVDADLPAEDRGVVAWPDCAFGDVRHVRHAKVHRHAADQRTA